MDKSAGVSETADRRDVFCLRALCRVYPSTLVDEVIERCNRKEERVRLLPARFVLYFVLALALFTDSSYREVMRKLVDSLRATVDGIQHWHTPGKGSITEARERLGAEPLQELLRTAVRPLGREGDRNVWYRGRWRVMAIDGLHLDVADTAANETAFGRPGHSRGEGSAYPQVRVGGVGRNGYSRVRGLDHRRLSSRRVDAGAKSAAASGAEHALLG
jgi:hypothetical protein